MKISKLWFEDEKIFILTDDGRTLWQSLLWYPRLKNATAAQRQEYEVDAYGIRWESIDEDMSLESFTYSDPEPVGISKLFLSHPELNISAVARKAGISQSLLAQYISGHKKPSEERAKWILDTVHRIGQELTAATL